MAEKSAAAIRNGNLRGTGTADFQDAAIAGQNKIAEQDIYWHRAGDG